MVKTFPSLPAGLNQVAPSRCEMVRGEDRFPGTLKLEEGYLYFRSVPLGPQKRPLAWELPVSVIDSVTLDSDILTICVHELQHRFDGASLVAICEALGGRLSSSDEHSLRDHYSEDEDDEVVMEGTIHLYRNRLLATRGQLTVTNSRLRFKPSGALDAMVWKDLELDFAIEDIRNFEMAAVKRMLTLQIEGQSYNLSGALAPHLYGVLVALRGDTVSYRPNAVVFSWSASMFRGPVTLTGELIGTGRRLRFNPTGRVDALFGITEEIAFKLIDISRVELRGAVDPRMVVYANGEEFVFALDNTAERFAEMQDFLVEVDHESEPIVPLKGATKRDREIDNLFDRWTERIPALERARMHLLGPVLDRGRGNRLRRGWLTVVGRLVIFLPAGGPEGGARPLVIPARRISRALQGTAPPEHLHMGVEGSTLRFVPRGGDPFVDSFWHCWQGMIDSIPVTEKAKPWSGPDDNDPFNRRDLYRAGLPQGTPGYVGLDEGRETDRVWAFEVESALAAAKEAEEEARDEDLPPPPIDFPRPPGSEGQLSDLSPEGCAVVLPDQLTTPDTIAVRFYWNDKPITLRGEIVYSTKLKFGHWRHGLLFGSLDPEADQDLRTLYMGLQRDQVAEEKERWRQAARETTKE